MISLEWLLGWRKMASGMYREGKMFRKEGGESVWLNLHISQPWGGQQRWPCSEILIADPVLEHQTELVPNEKRTVNSPFWPQSSWKTCNGAAGNDLWIIPGAYECQNVSPSPAAWARQSMPAVTWDKGSSWSLCEICHPWHNFGSANLQNSSPDLTLGHLRREQLRSARTGLAFSRPAPMAKKTLNCPGEERSCPSKMIKSHGITGTQGSLRTLRTQTLLWFSDPIMLRHFVASQTGSYLSFSAHGQSSPDFPSIKGENIWFIFVSHLYLSSLLLGLHWIPLLRVKSLIFHL